MLETQLSAFDSLTSMADKSDVVALVTVQEVRHGDVLDEDHSGTSTQIIAEVVVDSAIKGSGYGEAVQVWIGLRDASSSGDEASDLFTTQGYAPEVGDQLLVGLVDDPRSPGLYGIESNDSFLVLNDAGDGFREDVPTTNAQARDVRSRSLEDVLAELRAG